MNKKPVFLIFCVLMLSALTIGGSAQGTQCNLDMTPVYAALANLESAKDEGDTAGALAYLSEAFTLMENIKTDCNVNSLNWCYPGQPWGDGRCNAPDLTQEDVDWFWACGTYWAEYEAGVLDVVPEWCGYSPDSDGDGYPDNVDHCPNQGGYVDGNGCPLPCNPNVDADCDGTPDSYDQCPNDPNKIAPGACGCGSVDTDGDGVEDCVDACPADPHKIAPGVCLCGQVESADCDGDGVNNGSDACPLPGDDINVGDLCWRLGGIPTCTRVTVAGDVDGDGCTDQTTSVSAFGCAISAPNCP